MNCRKVRSYLSLYLDSELGPESTFEIAQHLDECDDCRARAEQEGRLESLIKSRLLNQQPLDSERWKRALAAAIPGKRRKVPIARWTILALAACVVLVAFWRTQVLHKHQHPELDLAAAVAGAHTELLAQPDHAFAISGRGDSIASFFRSRLSPEFRLNFDGLTECNVFGGSVCQVEGVQTAHIACLDAEDPISIFWMTVEDLSAFPAAQRRMNNEGPYIHCRVQPYEFCARRNGEAVVVGVGLIEEEQLKAIVEGLVSGNGI